LEEAGRGCQIFSREIVGGIAENACFRLKDVWQDNNPVTVLSTYHNPGDDL
jgi:hypothetical protein